jgi:hypothetical protein
MVWKNGMAHQEIERQRQQEQMMWREDQARLAEQCHMIHLLQSDDTAPVLILMSPSSAANSAPTSPQKRLLPRVCRVSMHACLRAPDVHTGWSAEHGLISVDRVCDFDCSNMESRLDSMAQ